MNFKLKALVAAAAIAVSGAASAATANDFFIEVYDAGSTQSFIADLGAVPVTGPTANVDLSAQFGSAWTSFTTAAGYTASSLSYLLLGTASTGVGDISQLGGLASWTGDYTVLAGLNSTATNAMAGALGSAGTAIVVASSAASAWAQTITGSLDYGTGLGPFGSAADGTTTMGLLHVTITGATQLTTSTLSSAGLLSFASAASVTPEPGSYALMAAGLLAVGAIVRRRSNV